MIELGDAPDRDDAWQRKEKTVQRSDRVRLFCARLFLRPGGGWVIELNTQK